MVRCGIFGLGVVSPGRLTGFVGAAVSGAVEPEVVVILDRMSAVRTVRTVDLLSYAMVVEATGPLRVFTPLT